MTDSFVHLHTHSVYSLLDGVSPVEDIVDAAAEDGQPAIALTDHKSMGGIPRLCKRAQGHGIQPIPGFEAYVVSEMGTKTKRGEDGKARYHMSLLAKNQQGYRNLMTLMSLGWTQGYQSGFPCIDHALMAKYSEGVIAMTGCVGSMFNQALVAGDKDRAVNIARELLDIYGPDHLYMETHNHGIDDEIRIHGDQQEIANDLGIGLVAAQDSHYTHREESEFHPIKAALSTGSKITEPTYEEGGTRFAFEGSGYHVATAAEMRETFPESDYPGACDNTLKIADMVDFELEVNKSSYLPKFPIPKSSSSKNDDEYLRELTLKGAEELYGDVDGEVPKKILKQIDYELKVIADKNFSSYFLIVGEILQWGKSRGIIIGPGRGSAAGSVVVYCMKITSVDPVEHNLSFERFLNPERMSMPDIDFDSDPGRRDELIQHAVDTYGEDCVAQIATYGYYKAKSSIRAAVRVLDMPKAMGDRLSNLYPPSIMQVDIPLHLVLEDNKKDVPSEYRSQWQNGEEMRELYRSDPDVRMVLDTASQLTGIIEKVGVHASGVVVTPDPVSTYAPLMLSPRDKEPMTQYDKVEAEEVGLLKIDFLGLENLRTISVAVNLIQRDLGKRIDINTLPTDDSKTYEMLCNGDSHGVFQLSGDGMRDLMVRLQPDRFADISALVALYRPGPMGSNAHISYADRKNGKEKIDTIHPDLREMLAETYGLPIYQEQIMEIARHFGGYTAGEADLFRRAMGKKSKDVMDEQYEHFVSGCEENGFGRDLGDQLWKVIEPFSGYAFNKSHSASYGMIAYWTAYLKANYPAQFAAACIETLGNDKKPAQIEFSRSQGINVYPPDINESNYGPRTSKESIWIGLGGISRCGPDVIQEIISERDTNGKFDTLHDFLKRKTSRTRKPAVEGLIHSGAFDQLHDSRKAMVETLPELMAAAGSHSEVDEEDDLFGLEDTTISVIDTIDIDGPDYPEAEKLAIERSVLGFYASTHPYELVEELVKSAIEAGDVPESAFMASSDLKPSDERVMIYGVIVRPEVKKTKAKKEYTKLRIEAGHGKSIPAVCFSAAFDRNKEGGFILAEGRIKEMDEGGVEFAISRFSLLSYAELKEIDEQVSSHRRPQLQVIDGDSEPRIKPRRRRKIGERSDQKPSNSRRGRSVVTFAIETVEQAQALQGLLSEHGNGDTPVVISVGGERISDAKLRYALTRSEAQSIARKVECDVKFDAR